MKKGWHGPEEIIRVTYDREQVDAGEMVRWLREAGTYRRTIPPGESGPARDRQ